MQWKTLLDHELDNDLTSVLLKRNEICCHCELARDKDIKMSPGIQDCSMFTVLDSTQVEKGEISPALILLNQFIKHRHDSLTKFLGQFQQQRSQILVINCNRSTLQRIKHRKLVLSKMPLLLGESWQSGLGSQPFGATKTTSTLRWFQLV